MYDVNDSLLSISIL